MDFSNTLRGITIEGHSPLPRPPYFVFALKTFRSRSLVLANGAQPGTFLSRATHVRSMERKKVGEVFHFFGHIGVAAIKLTDGSLAVGDTVQIQGPTTNLEQLVDSLQVEHGAVSNAAQGQEVGMKVRDRVREKDFVYKLVPPSEGAPAPKAPVKKAGPKKRTAKKRPAKKRRAKTPAKARKASRAPRKRARPSSRKSRRRSR